MQEEFDEGRMDEEGTTHQDHQDSQELYQLNLKMMKNFRQNIFNLIKKAGVDGIKFEKLYDEVKFYFMQEQGFISKELVWEILDSFYKANYLYISGPNNDTIFVMSNL
eukprot:TRINITY_DN1979_c0_g1_i22.p2 TRINITY_DN1979_c0_g1~~TRINITY_DN1979_c0_g1_i22.p2  ORF type:complete len:108 (-),score=16.20 TRINITY_DN1979_c0_g1_i22:51-374(-)